VLSSEIPVSFDGTAQPVQAGRIRLSAGLRSDPFFADVEAPCAAGNLNRRLRIEAMYFP
jgi:hypothetical protein